MPAYRETITNIIRRLNAHRTRHQPGGGDEIVWTLVEKTADYTLTASEMMILVDATEGPATITLPEASLHINRVYFIKKIDTSDNSVTIKGDSTSETIDGEQSIDISLQYGYVIILCDGSDWWILGGENVKLEDLVRNTQKAQETLLETLRTQLDGIWKCLSSMSSLNNYKEEK